MAGRARRTLPLVLAGAAAAGLALFRSRRSNGGKPMPLSPPASTEGGKPMPLDDPGK